MQRTKKTNKKRRKKKTIRNKFFSFRKLVCVICLILTTVKVGHSQEKITSDSIQIKEAQATFVAFTDFRNSFVLSDLTEFFLKSTPVTVYGAAVGLEFRNAHQYTLGFYGLTKNGGRRLAHANANTVNEQWNLNFINLGYTYTFFDKGKFECRIPLDIGFGKGRIKAQDNSNVIISRAGWIVPFQFGFLIDFELTRWFGLSSSIGYRKTIKGSIFKRNFDSPYYTFGLSFYFGNMKDDFLKYLKNRKAKRRNKQIEKIGK